MNKYKQYLPKIKSILIICFSVIGFSALFGYNIYQNLPFIKQQINMLRTQPKLNSAVNYEDNIPPEVLIKNSDPEYYIDFGVVTLRSFEDIDIADFSNVKKYITNKKNEFYYEFPIYLKNFGTNSIDIKYSDASGNSKTFTNNITRIAPISDVEMKYIESSKSDKVMVDPSKIDAYFDNTIKIPSYYVPSDLVTLNSYGINNFYGGSLRKEAAEQLKKLQNDINKAGINIYVTSAYRPYQQQIYTYNYISATEGENIARQKAAIPGHSEHQLGLAVDVVNEETRLQLPSPGQTTRLYTWLSQNAYKYGFMQTYKGGPDQYEEQWHWRYVGIDTTTYIKQNNIDLKQYATKNED